MIDRNSLCNLSRNYSGLGHIRHFTSWAGLHLLCLLFLLALGTGCSRQEDKLPHSYVTALDSSGKGFGVDSYAPDIPVHYPMAHALIAIAEANRYMVTRSSKALDIAVLHADWLCTNRDMNANGIPGWGFPQAWDAFGDGSVNPARTEYLITTTLALQALLDTCDCIKEASLLELLYYHGRAQKYLDTAKKVVDTILDQHYFADKEDGIVFWYSFRPQDKNAVVNVNAMFAGQLQRMSTYVEETAIQAKYRKYADSTVLYLLNRVSVKAGAWYWNYYEPLPPSRAQNVENYGVHAAYVVDGLMTYKLYGGTYGPRISAQALKQGLSLLIRDSRIMEMFSMPDRDALAWSLGYYLYVFSRYWPDDRAYSSIIMESILNREAPHGFFLTRDTSSPPGFVRHNAHILVGLSYYFWPRTPGTE